jgi:hypothetical protein
MANTTVSLPDLIGAMATAYGTPATTFTRAQLFARLTAAADTVVTSMKEETARVV